MRMHSASTHVAYSLFFQSRPLPSSGYFVADYQDFHKMAGGTLPLGLKPPPAGMCITRISPGGEAARHT